MAHAPPAYAGFAVKAQKDLTTLDPSRVYFLFQNYGGSVSAKPYNCPPSVGSEVSLDAPFWASHLNMLPVFLNHSMLVEAVRRKELVPPEEWRTLIAYQTGRIWPNTLTKLPPEDGRYSSATPPLISRAAQTDWLGAQGHMEYVCDYYSKDGYSMPEEQKKLPVKRPLAAELDEMAAKRDISWTNDADGITLIRNNRWYRDDALEVPEPLLRRWFGDVLETRKQEAARKKAGTEAAPQTPEEREAMLKRNWDWAAEVFSTLTPWQVYNGLALFQPEERDLAAQNIASTADLYGKSHPYMPSYIAMFPGYGSVMKPETRRPPFYDAINVFKQFPHTVQLYGTLDDTGRTALLEGRLPATALSAAQLAQASSLQPFLPQAMQTGPISSVYLGLFPDAWGQKRAVVYGEFFPLSLDLAAPPVP